MSAHCRPLLPLRVASNFRDSRLTNPGEPLGTSFRPIFPFWRATLPHCHYQDTSPSSCIRLKISDGGNRDPNDATDALIFISSFCSLYLTFSILSCCGLLDESMHVCVWMRACFHTTRHFPSPRSVCLFLPFSFTSALDWSHKSRWHRFRKWALV